MPQWLYAMDMNKEEKWGDEFVWKRGLSRGGRKKTISNKQVRQIISPPFINTIALY